jgi:O-antigen/teichoic acid export membrane protein
VTASFQDILRAMVQLGSGDALARLCSIAIVILLGHRYGTSVLGVYALAMTVSAYVQPLIDFGLRHVGARLVAQYPSSAGEIVRRVQRRRLGMAAATAPLAVIYALLANVPPEVKVWLGLFSATAALYALSLDWLAWGCKHFRLGGLARVLVPFCTLVAVLIGHSGGSDVLWWALAGYATGFFLQASIFQLWWKERRHVDGAEFATHRQIDDALALRRTCIMGVSIVALLVFSSIDTLMLGVMSSPEKVGLYSAAYRVVNQILVTYYLLTSVLYPQFSRQTSATRARMLRPRILVSLFGAGVVIAAIVTIGRGPILNLLFGHQFLVATPLLLLLAWAIPLDFLTSYLNNAYIAWGMERKTLWCVAIAASSNIILNLIWIPICGTTGAAVNTLVAYVVLLISLALAGRSVGEMASGPGLPADKITPSLSEPESA